MAFGVEKYDCNSKPETWLDESLVAVQIGSGDEFVAMRNLSLYLDGSARAWRNNLPESSIYSWRDFECIFKGTYKRHGGVQELRLCMQKPGESTRESGTTFRGGASSATL